MHTPPAPWRNVTQHFRRPQPVIPTRDGPSITGSEDDCGTNRSDYSSLALCVHFYGSPARPRWVGPRTWSACNRRRRCHLSSFAKLTKCCHPVDLPIAGPRNGVRGSQQRISPDKSALLPRSDFGSGQGRHRIPGVEHGRGNGAGSEVQACKGLQVPLHFWDRNRFGAASLVLERVPMSAG
jgi:hypothetical protein